MNKAYRLVWNAAKDAWIVAAEIVKGKGISPAGVVKASSVGTGERSRFNADNYDGRTIPFSSMIMALEPRFMFDAAGAATVDAMADTHRDTAPPPVAEKTVTDAVATFDFSGVLAKTLVKPVVDAPPPVTGVEVAFVDARVADIQTLLAGIKPGVKVFILDPAKDGVEQITRALKGEGMVSAIHIISHGTPGDLTLGSFELNNTTLAARSAEISAWSANLTEKADILIYGCDLAKGDIGATFVSSLARVTSADVAASTDKTGSAKLGDNWVLETKTGLIEANTLVLDRSGWDGELPSTVYDANRQTLNFDSTNKTSYVGTGTAQGDIVRFNSVITIGGQAIDAVVTTKTLTSINGSALSTLDYQSSGNQPSNVVAYLQPNMTTNGGAAGGSAEFTIDFYLGGTYMGVGTGAAVTLQNVVVNTYDIDSSGGGAADRQFQVFQGFSRYELVTASSFLTPSVLPDGSVKFLYNETPTKNNGTLAADGYRARVYYDSISSFKVQMGNQGDAGLAYFALDFSMGPDWTGATTITGTPAANVTFDAVIFTEAAANDGSIATTRTITLANDTFNGIDGQPLPGVTFSNVPAGLTATVTQTDVTHATLAFTGKAANHANANDINNVTVIFGDAAFTAHTATAVTGATRSDIVIDFADPKTISHGATTFSEAAANDGSISTVSTITLTGDTFTGAIGTALGTVTNVPAGLAANLVKVSTTTATLTLTGNATNHANANDITNLTVTFGNADFTGGSAAGVTGAVKNNLIIDFMDAGGPPPPPDAPMLSSSTPADNATGVSVSNDLTLTFDENVVAGTGLISLYSADGTLIESFNVANGNGSNGGTVLFNATTGVTLNPSADLASSTGYYLVIADTAVEDGSGNFYAGIADNSTLTFTTADVEAPTVAITALQNSLKAGETTTLTFTFSEIPIGFDAADVTLGSGTLGAITATGDPKVFTASYTPAANTEDAAMNIAVGTDYTDAAGNTGTAGSKDLAIDTKAPTVAITALQNSLKAGETTTLTFTFSEVPTGFTVGDITVESGGLSNFTVTADTKVYTATYTPATDTQDAAMNVAVGTGYTDAAGNTGTVGSKDLVIDTKAPAVGSLDIATDTDTGANDTITSHGNPVITFTGEAGLTITLLGADGTTLLTQGTQYTVDYSGGTYTVTLLDAVAGGAANPFGTYAGGAATGNNASVADGTYTIKATDGAANTTTIGTFIIDTTKPAVVPTVTAQTTSDTTPTIVGSATLGAGETLSVLVNGVIYRVGDGNLSYDNAGKSWSLTIPGSNTLPANTYSVTATVTDIAGNVTSDATTNELRVTTPSPPSPPSPPPVEPEPPVVQPPPPVIDTTPPVVGSLDITTATDTGSNDTSTGNGNPVITFSGEAGLTISLVGADGSTLLTQGTQYTVSYSGGTYTVTLLDSVAGGSANPFGTYASGAATGNAASVADGTYTIRATDGANNKSTVGTFVIETTKPSVEPTVTPLTTSSTTPTINGTARITAGETLTITVSGATYTVVPDASGNWSLNLGTAVPTAGGLTPLTSGTVYQVTATITDRAGNSRSDTSGGELVIAASQPSTTPPTIPAPETAPPAPRPADPPAPSAPSAPVGQIALPPFSRPVTEAPFTNAPNSFSTAIDGVVVLGGTTSTSQRGLYVALSPSSRSVEVNQLTTTSLPAGTFYHSDVNAKVSIEATLQDGSPLPGWIKFDASTGRFETMPPVGSDGTLIIRLTARDSDGNAVSAEFVLDIRVPKSLRPNGGDADNSVDAPGKQENIPDSKDNPNRGGRERPDRDSGQPRSNITPDLLDGRALNNFIATGALKGRPSLADQLSAFDRRGPDVDFMRAFQKNIAQKQAVL